MDSILDSVKKDLGIVEEYHHFDDDIIMAINTVFSVLTQLGVGPENGFSITDSDTTWDEYLNATNHTNYQQLEFVKTYVSKRAKIIFDPPASSAVSESIKSVISELEWRINVAVDPKPEEEVENDG